MKINKFKCVAVLGLAVFLSSCGGGGGSSSVNGGGANPPVKNEDDDLNKVLPFDLNKPDGTIASVFGFGAPSISLSFGHVQPTLLSEPVTHEGEQDNPANPILYSSFIEPECSSGSMVFSENTPPTPVRLNDINPWPALSIVEINAQRCRFENNGGFIDGLISGRREFTEGDEADTSVYTTELTNFISSPSEGLTDEAILADSYSVTGSVYRSSVSRKNSDDEEIEIIVPHLEYIHASGVNLVVTDFSQKLSTVSGVTTVQPYSYNVKWNIPEGLESDNISDAPIGVLVGSLPEKNFSPGEYNLSVLVTSPLVYNPIVGNGLLRASSGSATVNLLSHNMKADIVYHQGYADVTYSSLEGGIKQVRINADLSTEIISP